MEGSILDELVVGVISAIIGALLAWLLPPLWKSPEKKRLEQVQRASIRKAENSPVFQNASGEQRIQFFNYLGSSTSANSEYIATGQGQPAVPDVQRWLHSKQGHEPRAITRFEGELAISQMANYEAEVFYTVPFIRNPNLDVSPVGGNARFRVEQRPDGFKVKAELYTAFADGSLKAKWVADGELAGPVL